MTIEPVPFEPHRLWIHSESQPSVWHIVDLTEKPFMCSCWDSLANENPYCKHVRAVIVAECIRLGIEIPAALVEGDIHVCLPDKPEWFQPMSMDDYIRGREIRTQNCEQP